MRSDVPLLIPEVNPDHLALVRAQPYDGGLIVTNPNCAVNGLTLALAPLDRAFGLEAVQVATMQAVSGAGDAGAAALAPEIADNVIPHIAGEEAKVETEPRKILGRRAKFEITDHPLTVSAACHRVAVSEGHLAAVSVKLARPATAETILAAWRDFRGPDPVGELPSAPARPLHYLPDSDHPQPRLHRDLDGGMGVALGRLRPCPVLDWKFAVLVHNTVRGAAGAAILNAELLVREGYLEESAR
jgi:aspartate-semialdehyde dehydrogenase